MAIDTIIQGNATKLVIPLTENGTPYTGLSGADAVKLAMVKHSDSTIEYQVDDTDPNVTLDDGDTGTISWQMTSAQTALLDISQYSLAVQVQNTTEFLEWQDVKAYNIKKQLIPNS